jgi:Predicted drug exporters of the RND superfamily
VADRARRDLRRLDRRLEQRPQHPDGGLDRRARLARHPVLRLRDAAGRADADRIAVASILNTFSLVWALTYITNVSIIVQFLIALVGSAWRSTTALLMIFRFRDELREGEDVETALVETMTHGGTSVIVSGTTVAVGLLSLIVIPLPFIRSMGIGGMLIPAVSVLAAITLLPAMLAVLGTNINSVRVMPKRFVDHGHPEDGVWGKWARLVLKRPWVVAGIGTAIVAVLVAIGIQLNPNEAQLKNFPGTAQRSPVARCSPTPASRRV